MNMRGYWVVKQVTAGGLPLLHGIVNDQYEYFEVSTKESTLGTMMGPFVQM